MVADVAEFEQIMKALRAADKAGDTEAAQRLAQMAREFQQTQQPEQTQPEQPGIGSVLYENIIGSGAVDTPGERLGQAIGDVAQAGAAGISRGITSLADLPGQAAGAVGGLLERGATAAGADPSFAAGLGSAVSGAIPGGTARQDIAELTGGATEFRGETLPGQFAGTVGEFLPGAAIGGGGAGALARFGVAPGIASEAAGQVTEGTQFEPIARTVAALATPALLSKSPDLFSQAIRGADPERISQANTLIRFGVKPTAGQATGFGLLQRAENSLAPTGKQLDDFTAAAMKTIGSKATRATPQALSSAETRIVTKMQDALKGVNVAASADDGNAAIQIASDYVERVPQGSLIPRIRGISNEILDAATNPKAADIPLSTIRKWRTDIGKYSVSPDQATRDAAHSLRGILDSMTDRALLAAKRPEALDALRTARTEYRNLLAIKDASSKAGEAAAVGQISPARLRGAVVRTQGKSQYVTGKSTELGELARAGEAVLSPAATVAPGAERAIAGLPQAGLATAGFYAGGVPGAIAGAAAPSVGRAGLRSPAVQAAIGDPTTVPIGAARLAPGIALSNEEPN